MKKRLWKTGIVLLLALSMVCSCAQTGRGEEDEEIEESSESTRRSRKDRKSKKDKDASQEGSAAEASADGSFGETMPAGEYGTVKTMERPRLLRYEATGGDRGVVPNVAPYTVASDLSNVDNPTQFYFEDEAREKLVQNGFVVCGTYGSEFFEIYEDNRYFMYPSFVTVDSMMHTYHLYFSYLLKNVERQYLADDMLQLSRRMLEDSLAQYNELKGTEWEEAARRNLAFFTVGSYLLDPYTEVEPDVYWTVDTETSRIYSASGIEVSEISGTYEDYTQYIPRGYYEGDERLERYFRAMMWYGRISFVQEDEDRNRSALLITEALAQDAEAYRLWSAVYAVTSFFAGASDDLGVCEYWPAICAAYGENFCLSDLVGNEKAFRKFCTLTADLPAPQINSIPINDGENNVIPSFRFMGQRFSVDALVMQNLIYSNIKENNAGMVRMLPDVLDVPAALGSDVALEILRENGETDYRGYMENMEKLRDCLTAENEMLWSASLYAGWLNTLRPLLTVKGAGYPMFMQNEEWAKKDLECFAGSYAELKHDTILYSKQVIAEMGGDDWEEPDYRGYVEPEPVVYERFASLADMTARGLKDYGMLSASDEENLGRLVQMARILQTISEKELRDEVLTEDEYDFIKAYGGNIEHFWYEAAKDMANSEWINSQEFPAAIVADIATDPNGAVLEVATGNPSSIYVVVKVDGNLRIARGSVYSFYQFPWPMSDRLTDSSWRQMMGFEVNEDGYYYYGKPPVDRPAWTESYRYDYRYW